MAKTAPLTPAQTKYLRGIAHGLNPVVTIGNNGLSESVMNELESSLEHHELLKIKIAAGDREDRKIVIEDVIKHTGAQMVQSIGKVFVIYRAKEKPELELPRG